MTTAIAAPAPEPGRKDDAHKLERYDLIPTTFLRGLARVLGLGAKKYAPDNWSKVEDPKRRYIAALYRHVEAWRAGQQLDPEWSCHHLDHAAACLSFLRALDVGQVGTEPGAPAFAPGDGPGS